MKIFSIYDSKAEAFITPFFSQSTGTALREFEQAANEEGHQFYKYGGDYSLHELGAFDEFTGKISLLTAPIDLGLAMTLKRSEMAPTPIRSTN